MCSINTVHSFSTNRRVSTYQAEYVDKQIVLHTLKSWHGQKFVYIRVEWKKNITIHTVHWGFTLYCMHIYVFVRPSFSLHSSPVAIGFIVILHPLLLCPVKFNNFKCSKMVMFELSHFNGNLQLVLFYFCFALFAYTRTYAEGFLFSIYLPLTSWTVNHQSPTITTIQLCRSFQNVNWSS